MREQTGDERNRRTERGGEPGGYMLTLTELSLTLTEKLLTVFQQIINAC
jgi:hypothetical protein